MILSRTFRYSNRQWVWLNHRSDNLESILIFVCFGSFLSTNAMTILSRIRLVTAATSSTTAIAANDGRIHRCQIGNLEHEATYPTIRSKRTAATAILRRVSSSSSAAGWLIWRRAMPKSFKSLIRGRPTTIKNWRSSAANISRWSITAESGGKRATCTARRPTCRTPSSRYSSTKMTFSRRPPPATGAAKAKKVICAISEHSDNSIVPISH